MTCSEDSESEITFVRYVDSVVESEETIGVGRPLGTALSRGFASSREFGRRVWRGLRREDVRPELVFVQGERGSEDRLQKNRRPEGGSKLLLSEYWSKVVWVDNKVVTIILFWVDVPLASQ